MSFGSYNRDPRTAGNRNDRDIHRRTGTVESHRVAINEEVPVDVTVDRDTRRAVVSVRHAHGVVPELLHAGKQCAGGRGRFGWEKIFGLGIGARTDRKAGGTGSESRYKPTPVRLHDSPPWAKRKPYPDSGQG